MPDYKMNIRGHLGLSEYSDIYDYMAVVEEKDNFMITFDNTTDQDKSMITSMLKENRFDILDQGLNTKGSYYINAIKNKI